MGFAASNDTIVAVSSAVGAAARMIVRASGNDALALARAVIESSPDAPGGLLRCRLRVRDMSVPATVYAFVGPRSYTGEDLVEFHVPGNPLLARLLLEDLLGQGARLAEPGEFTARAYFNGRLDLSAAEGVAAAVSAQNEQELRAARQLMSGELARRLRPAMDLLAETLGLVEVGIDFSDEDVTVLAADALRARIETVDAMLSDLLSTSARFARMAHEVQIVLVGRPNAGKSMLLNALAGVERAVVSPVAGTTRDAVSADVPLPRGIVRMIDVAGLQEDDAPPAEDASPQAQIARAMQQRALEALERADAVVLVREANDRRPPLALPRPTDLLVMSKLDEAGDAARSPAEAGEANWQAVSALTGERMDALRQRLDELAFGADAHQPALALNARHLDAIGEARHALARCGQHVSAGAGAEILALELREALDALGTILGQVTPDDVLGRIFATFCIGK